MAEEEKKVTKKKSTSTKPKTSTSTKKASTTKKSTATKTAPKKTTGTKSATAKKSTGTKKSTSAKSTTTKKESTTTKKSAGTKKATTAKKTGAPKKTTNTKKGTSTKKTTTTKKSASTKKTSTAKKSTTKSTPKKSSAVKKNTPVKKEVEDKSFLFTSEYDFHATLNIDEDKVDNTIKEDPEVKTESNFMDVLNIDEDRVENTIEEVVKPEEEIVEEDTKLAEEETDSNFMDVLNIDEDKVNNTIEEVTKPEEVIVEEEVTITEVSIERPKKTVKSRKIKRWVYRAILIIIGLLLVLSLLKISGNLISLNNRLNKKYIHSIDAKYKEFEIDFEGLKKQNSDTIGYVKVNGTNINHVVVQGSDNDYYKNHNFLKKNSRSGWVFMDFNNKIRSTEENIAIYGKNSKDMFGSLNKVFTKKWLENEEYHYITFATEDNENRYKVFSIYESDLIDIEVDFDTLSDYTRYLRNITEKTTYDFEEKVGLYDNIITLVSYNDSKMIVVHAKRIDNESEE